MPYRLRAVYAVAPPLMLTATAHMQTSAVAATPATAVASPAAAGSNPPSAAAAQALLNATSAPASAPRPLPVLVQIQPPKSQKTDTGFKHMIAGSLAGMASKTILQPLDLVKVRLQVQDGTGKNEYKGEQPTAKPNQDRGEGT